MVIPFILFYFNSIVGPDVAVTEPADLLKIYSTTDIQKIIKAMDSASEGFFTFTIDSFTTANYLFPIKSKWGRGGSELIMITGIVQEKEPDYDMYERNFRDFERTVKKDPDIFKALYFRNETVSSAERPSVKKKYEDLQYYLSEVARTFQLLFHTHGSLHQWRNILQDRHVTLPAMITQDVREFNLDRNKNCFVVYRKKADTIKIDLIPIEGSTVLKVSVFFKGTLTPEIINDLLATFMEQKLKAVFTSGLCVEGSNCIYEVYVDPQDQRDNSTIIAKIMTIQGINDVRVTPIMVAKK